MQRYIRSQAKDTEVIKCELLDQKNEIRGLKEINGLSSGGHSSSLEDVNDEEQHPAFDTFFNILVRWSIYVHYSLYLNSCCFS